MSSMIKRWYRVLQQKPWLVAFALVAMAAAGVLLIGFTVLASDVILTPTAIFTPVPAPSIQLLPAAGGPGTFVVVTGEGWRPADTVFVRLDGLASGQETQVPVASAAVTEEGRFTAPFIFPQDARLVSAPRVLVTAWSPATGDEAWAVFQVLASVQTATPAPTATQPAPTPTATPTQSAPTATPTPVAQPTATPTPGFTAWRGEYYGNRDLAGAPVLVRNDAEIRFDWGAAAPAVGLPADGFSARWTRTLSFQGGTYRFYTRTDDGVRVWLDSELIVDRWHDASGTTYSAERTLGAGAHTLRVEYYENGGVAQVQFWWERVSDFPQWRGEYWPNRRLDGRPVLVRNDVNVDFAWGRGAPAAGLPADDFSARWTRTAEFDGATYRFHVVVDDGARLWVDDQLILDAWRDGAARELTTDYALVQGSHSLRVEYYEHTGEARIHVWWEKVSSPSYPDWKGEYWSNWRLKGAPALVRNDARIDFYWGTGAARAGLPADDFSARWSRKVTFEPGVYRFYAWADDGMRVYVDDTLALDEWHDSSGGEVYMVDLTLRGEHRLAVEYYERGGEALVKFWWKRVGDWPTPPTPTYTPTATPTMTPTATPTITPTTMPTNTPTPTPTATPVLTSTSVRLNEILPVPAAMDWDGDGTASEQDEWIELYNGGTSAVDLGGWALDDGAAGSKSYRIPAGTALQAGAFAVFYRRETGLALSDEGGELRLFGPDGAVVDVVTFGALDLDASYSRNDGGTWHTDWPPSPGEPNQPAAAGPRGVLVAVDS